MTQHNERGSIVWIVAFCVAMVLFVLASAFGYWAYNGMQDYKLNTNQKIAAAVAVAKQQESQSKDIQFAAEQKNPLRTYNGPAAYGSLVIKYPKTWSAYVSDASNSDPFVNAYFHPQTVPSTNNNDAAYALHVQVVGSSYSNALQTYSGQVQSKQATAAPYKLPLVPGIVGTIFTGQVGSNNTLGTVIVLPMRDKSLIISTDTYNYLDDFNNIILPNLSFTP